MTLQFERMPLRSFSRPRSSACATPNAFKRVPLLALLDHAKYPSGPPQALAPTPRVRHCASVSQAASPISAAMSRIRLVVLITPVAVDGRAVLLVAVGAPSTAPFMVATGAVLMGAAGADGCESGVDGAGTTQADKAMRLSQHAQVAATG